MYFKNQIHKKVYLARIANNPYKCSNTYLAAMYLLSADAKLWMAAKPAISLTEIHFEEINLRGCSPISYALCKAANDLYQGTSHLELCDLIDQYLISKKVFELILTSLRIGRYG